MSDVLARLEAQRKQIGTLRDEKVRCDERHTQLDRRFTEITTELQEMGITGMGQVEALEAEANTLADQVQNGLTQVNAKLEEINGPSKPGAPGSGL